MPATRFRCTSVRLVHRDRDHQYVKLGLERPTTTFASLKATSRAIAVQRVSPTDAPDSESKTARIAKPIAIGKPTSPTMLKSVNIANEPALKRIRRSSIVMGLTRAPP